MSGDGDGALKHALADLAGALLPLSLSRLSAEAQQRLAKIPNQINEFGFDPYGMSPDTLRSGVLPSMLLYRHYFRCEVFGAERVPPGRALVIANHAGQLPFDAMMLMMALLLECEPPRIARAMGEYFLPRLPFLSVLLARGGSMVGTPENCIHMLQNEECVMVFPEGVRGMNKTFDQRYQLQRFGLGFARLALATRTPIVPVGIVGSEEQQPSFANLEGLGRLLGLPALPITPGLLAFGPLGMLPLPTKYRIYFGEPLQLSGDEDAEDATVSDQVERVKSEISQLLSRGLRERRGIFS